MNLHRTYSSNARFCHMLSTDGSLYCWGCSYGHALGLNVVNEQDVSSPTKFTLPPNPRGGPTLIESMSSGEAHSLIITRDDPPLVYAWGNNSYGQLGLGHKDEVQHNFLSSLFSPPSPLCETTTGLS
jgi:alpha-tubulin suppressor-like RCC1 family protein